MGGGMATRTGANCVTEEDDIPPAAEPDRDIDIDDAEDEAERDEAPPREPDDVMRELLEDEARDLAEQAKVIPIRPQQAAQRVAILAVDAASLETPPVRSYPTGMPDLDELIGGGVSTRQLLAVLGPPGAGKSAWAVSAAIHIAQTIPVLVASTELEVHELKARFAGHRLDRSWSAIDRGHVRRDDVIRALDGVQVWFVGTEHMPRSGDAALNLVQREAETLAKRFGVPPLVIVDYLQDLARGSEKDVRGRIGEMATSLRVMSRELDCPMIAVSSVARSYYSAKRAAELRALDDPTVYLAAAKESGDVDYASAVVMFLDVEEKKKVERDARIAVAKSRHGRPGFAGARFNGANGRWTSAPEVVASMSTEGREEAKLRGKVARAERDLVATDEKVLKLVIAKHRAGERELATATQLRAGQGIGVDAVKASLERLVEKGKLVVVEIERAEGTNSRGEPKMRKRLIYDLPSTGGSDS
jgi:replicative DNA helicase